MREVSVKGVILIWIGLIIQLGTYLLTKGTTQWLSFASGCFGVISVVLCSEKKLGMYTFGFLQLGTYLILCWKENLYGELGENIFYLCTMILGVFFWKQRYNEEQNEVYVAELGQKTYFALVLGMILSGFIVGWCLKNYTDDTQPWLDAFSTVPAIIAQILMILRFREQWYFWLLVDILTGILWFRSGDWCMVAQYVFWTGNCIYGLKEWKKT